MSSNFDKVMEFNKTFSSPCYDKFSEDIFNDKHLIKLRLDLIKEEVEELSVALNDNNITEVVDALGDILVVTYGAFDAFGVDGDKVFNEVHNSNMSKLCITEDEAIDSVEWYKEEGKYDSPSYRLCETGKGYVVYNMNSGKILKNQSKNNKWREPDFSKIEEFVK